jgi:tetrahydromethanopterin S-methyltransferase subunit C
MSENKNSMPKVFLITIGIIGFIAGIFLTLNGNKIMGIAGSVASVAIAIKGINELRKEKKSA